MGVFDKGVDLKEFEVFRTETLEAIRNLEKEISLKATDSEDIARKAANNAVNIEKNIKETATIVADALTALTQYSDEAKEELLRSKTARQTMESDYKSVAQTIKKTEAAYELILEVQKSADASALEIAADFKSIKTAILDSQKLPDEIETSKKLLESSKTISDDISSLLTHSMKKKSEIDELHKTILGSDIKNTDGEIEHIDGLIDALNSSYDNIRNQVENLNTQTQDLIETIKEKHEEQLEQDNIEFEKIINESSSRFSAIDDQLTGLLPGAMAEGLSAAYEKKKDDEIASQNKYEFSFKIAIFLMVLVSLIPFSVDIYLLGWKGSDLVQVIKDTPSLIVSILPLYFPVLWFAYSSNKKLNLSKRLIEEYTHKAVLGKTFSGLSNQIESLPRESEVRDELRTRLLFNLLQVSSENPGKLITDYNKSDHPLMDALENSAKLSDSVDALSKVPGFSAIAKKLSSKADEMLFNESQKVIKGLATQDLLEEKGAPSSSPLKIT